MKGQVWRVLCLLAALSLFSCEARPPACEIEVVYGYEDAGFNDPSWESGFKTKTWRFPDNTTVRVNGGLIVAADTRIMVSDAQTVEFKRCRVERY